MPGVMWNGGWEGGRIEKNRGVCVCACSKAVMEESRDDQK